MCPSLVCLYLQRNFLQTLSYILCFHISIVLKVFGQVTIFAFPISSLKWSLWFYKPVVLMFYKSSKDLFRLVICSFLILQRSWLKYFSGLSFLLHSVFPTRLILYPHKTIKLLYKVQGLDKHAHYLPGNRMHSVNRIELLRNK